MDVNLCVEDFEDAQEESMIMDSSDEDYDGHDSDDEEPEHDEHPKQDDIICIVQVRMTLFAQNNNICVVLSLDSPLAYQSNTGRSSTESEWHYLWHSVAW